MELTTFIRIARRFWWLIIIPALTAGGLSLWFDLQQPTRYAATARLLLSYPVTDTTDTVENWQIIEYLIDDLPQVLSSATFAARAQPLLSARNVNLTLTEIQQGLRMTPLHRAVDLRGEATSPEAARALVEAAIELLHNDGLTFWGRSGKLNVVVLDSPDTAQPTTSLRAMLIDAALRAALGIVAGFALAVTASLFSSAREEGLWKSATM
ncbi:lipopolysaccharide biosynthesis protein [Chloroflexus sp.]|uniref:lipopolysaccharide biosynthesis protein n=1 Tax=Chloroflexus sp. TaxID=1904827 RepID=UPI00262775C8|nr:lipopolysaccharide biosynthesis protein [uncultured Chloroflexus sp.]